MRAAVGNKPFDNLSMEIKKPLFGRISEQAARRTVDERVFEPEITRYALPLTRHAIGINIKHEKQLNIHSLDWFLLYPDRRERQTRVCSRPQGFAETLGVWNTTPIDYYFHLSILDAMKTYSLPNTSLQVTRIAYGCMQIGGNWSNTPMTKDERAKAARVVETALAQGITFFDHADIYCRGKSESVFAEIMHDMKIARDSIILESKCGIRFADDPNPGDPLRYDFSYEHIMRTVEGSLKRLQTDYLDILLLHRPDALMEPAEIARAFDDLHAAGKVRYFGVSNQNWAHIQLLKKFVRQPLVINQLQLSLLHAELIADGLYMNRSPLPYTGITGTLDYCRTNDILVQAWAPVANGRLFNPPQDSSTNAKRAAGLIAHMAQMKNTTPEAIALGWLLRHPAPIQPILGTTNPDRVTASCRADEVELTREEWYALLRAASQEPLP